MDVPELITVFVEKSPGPAPYQGKAIGEMSTPAAAAAVANAVADATGVHITALPVTGEKVLEGLKASKRTLGA